MPVDSDSLGTYLRQERERRQVSLQEIAAATKIQLKFLEALENDAYERLPAAPFVVGFLRAYAQYIALDPEMILTAYRSLHHTPEPADHERPTVDVPARATARPSFVRLGAILVGAGLVLGLAIHEFRRGPQLQSPVASFPAPPQSSPGSVPTPTMPGPPSMPRAASPEPVAPPAPATTAPGSEPGPQQPGTAVSASAQAAPPGAGMSPASSSLPLPPDSTPLLVLQAKALEDTWLRIEIDGNKPLSLLLTSGKSIQWEANERFRLTIGNARGTRLVLNGQDIPLQAGRGNVVRDFLLTRSSLQ